jgi:predicted nucleotidyltransferase component of viral defense system
MSVKDYRKLYRLQDKLLPALKPLLSSFYLTGGTALGRFYLKHRFSEDLDFFTNQNKAFHTLIKTIETSLINKFAVLKNLSMVSDDFVRYYVEQDETILKVEFVNDIAYRCGIPNDYKYGLIDTPLNILTNKLTALVGRDEPKDVFDIFTLAEHYQFNWLEVFNEAKNKALINEIDVEQRIQSFLVQHFQLADWIITSFDYEKAANSLQTIANDFFLGLDNSLGKNMLPIKNAIVIDP